MFRGQFRHTIDPKGRLSIPAKFRDALADGYGEKLVIVPVKNSPVKNFLQAHPLKKWEEIEARVSALPRFDEDAWNLRHFYLSHGQDVTLDAQGRIQISPDYRERAGLVKDVVIVGMTDWFEVWNTEHYAMHQSGDREPLGHLFNRLAAKGV